MKSERNSANKFNAELMKLVMQFTHPDWDLTAGEVVGILEMAKATVINAAIKVTKEESDGDDGQT